MRSQWKRSGKFDTGSRHFERILKARPHIRDVIPSELAQSSKANVLLFCSKFSCELKNLARAVKPEPKRVGKGEWLPLTCLKRTNNCQRSGSNSYVGMRDSCQKNSKMCTRATSLWVETQEGGHWRKMLSDNFSTEGRCKGTYCKRTAHRMERKEVAISYTFHV